MQPLASEDWYMEEREKAGQFMKDNLLYSYYLTLSVHSFRTEVSIFAI